MKCPACNAHDISADARHCPDCGAELITAESTKNQVDESDDLEFVVSEAHNQDPEFVGAAPLAPTKDDDLDFKTTSDLVEDEARTQSADDPADTDSLSPIGRTDAPLPPNVDEPESERVGPSRDVSFRLPADSPSPSSPRPDDPAGPANKKERDQGQYLSAQEKEEIIRMIGSDKTPSPGPEQKPTPESTPASPGRPNAAIQVAGSEMPPPAFSERGRGIAYFYRNYIQITGSQRLHADDEMQVRDRCYRLKPKKVRPGFLIGAGGIVFAAILFFVASLLVSGGGTGDGEVIGVALDDNGRPYVQGAVIRFPDLGVAVESSPQGFFRSGAVPSGTHKVVYKIEGVTVGEDFVTVVGGEVSTVSLSPIAPEKQTTPTTAKRSKSKASPKVASKPSSKPTSSKSAPKPKSTSKKSSGSKYAKLTLAVNIEGARLSLDGNVIGAGNMTYSRVTTGRRKYLVEADGYEPASGDITLKAGDTHKLEIELKPMATAQKEVSYTAEDYYYSGTGNVKAGEIQTALSDFGKAIEMQPSYAEAYLARADLRLRAKETQSAYDDYIRAAEIWRFKKDYNQAVSAYTGAIEADGKALNAYLGRGDVFLAQGQEIAAIADYDAAKSIDKKSFAAHFGLGKARFKMGHHNKAIKHFKDARKIDDHNPAVYQFMMLSYLAENDFDEVKKSYEEFTEVASEAEVAQLASDSKYSAVLRIVDEY